MIIEIFILLCLNGLIFYFNWKYSTFSGDNNMHPRIIEEIKNNNYRFLRAHPSFAYEKNFLYPQLLHWIISFFPTKYSHKAALYQVMVFNIFSVLLVYYVGNQVLDWQYYFSVGFVAAILYTLTPFNFAGWNSKLVGISGRAFGVFFAHLSLLCSYVYLISDRVELVVVNVIIGLILLMGNQFGFQFFAFSSVLFALFFKKVELSLQIPIVFALFLAITRTIGVKFLKGQLSHKYFYFRYLYKFIILRLRKTIYLDLVYWVWIYLKNDFKKNIPYFLFNPIVSVVLLMPFSCYFLYLVFMHFPDLSVLEKMGLVGFALFIAFSFKRTRFLGEPERYVEIAYPIMLICSIEHIYQSDDVGYSGFFLIISISLIIVLLMYSKASFVSNEAEIEQEKILANEINLIKADGLFIASNNTVLIDPLLKSKHWILKPIFSSQTFAGEPVVSVFTPPDYKVLNREQLLKVIRYYHFDVLVMDLGLWDADDYNSFCDELVISERKRLDSKTEILIYTEVTNAV